VEVTPASSVASDGSGNPSFRLLVGGKVGAEARAVVAASIIRVSSSSYSSGWGAQWWCRGRLQWEHRGAVHHRLSPAEARKKSPAAPAPVVDAPAPRAGGGAASPSG
jgi:hypothetical protein